MSIIFAPFSRGAGFVLHKVRLPGSIQDFSAWFDGEGDLLDQQAHNPFHANRRSGFIGKNQRAELQKIGSRYVDHYKKWLQSEQQYNRMRSPGGQRYFG